MAKTKMLVVCKWGTAAGEFADKDGKTNGLLWFTTVNVVSLMILIMFYLKLAMQFWVPEQFNRMKKMQYRYIYYCCEKTG